jgi:hypothetical protein
MNIIAEKAEIMRRISEEQDESVIHAVKEILDNASGVHFIYDEALERELEISIEEADNGEELPFEEVSARLRKKYAA